eukprot:PhM_4_TR5221/c0_g1_i1/m.54865
MRLSSRCFLRLMIYWMTYLTTTSATPTRITTSTVLMMPCQKHRRNIKHKGLYQGQSVQSSPPPVPRTTVIEPSGFTSPSSAFSPPMMMSAGGVHDTLAVAITSPVTPLSARTRQLGVSVRVLEACATSVTLRVSYDASTTRFEGNTLDVSAHTTVSSPAPLTMASFSTKIEMANVSSVASTTHDTNRNFAMYRRKMTSATSAMTVTTAARPCDQLYARAESMKPTGSPWSFRNIVVWAPAARIAACDATRVSSCAPTRHDPLGEPHRSDCATYVSGLTPSAPHLSPCRSTSLCCKRYPPYGAALAASSRK